MPHRRLSFGGAGIQRAKILTLQQCSDWPRKEGKYARVTVVALRSMPLKAEYWG